MTNPTVSVVLPTFNRPKFLRPAVDSVFAQTFTDWELIVADDGSEGETAAYLATLANPPRVNVLRLPHTGNPGAVRNAAWQTARGEYIAFLDSDDVWIPEKLALQVASLRSHPEYGWGHTAFAVIDDSGKLLTGARALWWPATEGWILESLIRMKTVIATSSLIVKRQLLEHLGGFDPEQRMCEDYDLFLRFAALSAIDGVRDTLLLKRRHGEHHGNNALAIEEGLRRAFEKMLAAGTHPALHPVLRRERAKLAASTARIQAIWGSRGAALHTLLRSSLYSWGYPEWWRGAVGAVVRAVTPASVVRMARIVAHRNRGG
jgi:glycosyltransferase involved in cell wall biosynthesis